MTRHKACSGLLVLPEVGSWADIYIWMYVHMYAPVDSLCWTGGSKKRKINEERKPRNLQLNIYA